MATVTYDTPCKKSVYGKKSTTKNKNRRVPVFFQKAHRWILNEFVQDFMRTVFIN